MDVNTFLVSVEEQYLDRGEVEFNLNSLKIAP
jgi:hypothetical protein